MSPSKYTNLIHNVQTRIINVSLCRNNQIVQFNFYIKLRRKLWAESVLNHTTAYRSLAVSHPMYTQLEAIHKCQPVASRQIQLENRENQQSQLHGKLGRFRHVSTREPLSFTNESAQREIILKGLFLKRAQQVCVSTSQLNLLHF
ncbi:Hypothetical_protein [Hexamita inflata]|uniref:Hypothetical_protein n=1 Tax=Hexamita inflata TaxID=28002 RepID=A0ABP1HGK5_9EUKA